LGFYFLFFFNPLLFPIAFNSSFHMKMNFSLAEVLQIFEGDHATTPMLFVIRMEPEELQLQ